LIITSKKPGPENTEHVINAILERTEEVKVNKIVVASTSGDTAVKLCKALEGRIKVIAISYEKMKGENNRGIREMGG